MADFQFEANSKRVVFFGRIFWNLKLNILENVRKAMYTESILCLVWFRDEEK